MRKWQKVTIAIVIGAVLLQLPGAIAAGLVSWWIIPKDH